MKLDIYSKKLRDKVSEFQTHVSHSFNDASFSREERIDDFQDAWKYYRVLDPVQKCKGDNKEAYREPVLRETVDSIHPSILNVFCENDSEAVVFRTLSKFVKSATAEAVNNTINDIFLRQNSGYEKIYDASLEALVTGDCYGKVYSCEEIVTDTFISEEWLPYEFLSVILEEYPDTDIEQFKTRNKTIKGQKIKEFKTEGEVELTRIETKIKFDYIPFGEIYVDPIATSIDTARYIAHRTIQTKGELLDRFPDCVEQIQAANTINSLSESNTSNFKLETLKEHASKDDYYTSFVDETEVDVYLYEHWIYSSLLDKDNKTKYYQVFTVDGEATEILEVNEVEPCDMPFIKGEVQPLPDSLWGISLYSMCKHEQDLMTRLTDQIARNGDNANFRRYTAVKGAYDRRSLLDNRPGGVVEIQTQGAIDIFPYHQLPQATNDLYTKLSENVSKVKGNALSPDLSGSLNNVAASTVAMAVQNMEMKDKKFSKAFALSFMKPLFEKIYLLMKKEDYPIEHNGTVINGSSLPSRYDFVVDVNTSNDNARIAGQLMNIAMAEAQLSQAKSPLITPQKRYNIFAESLKYTGISPEKFLENPADQPKPDPQVVAQQQAFQKGMRDLEFQQKNADYTKTLAEITEINANIERDKEKSINDFLKVTGQLEQDGKKVSLENVRTGLEELNRIREQNREDFVATRDLSQHAASGEPIQAQYHIS
ncbi:TPA: hypothetical protein RSW61_001925 [Vibrio harveyi]|nr:hypothetical protein [Vibrio harveyi]